MTFEELDRAENEARIQITNLENLRRFAKERGNYHAAQQYDIEIKNQFAKIRKIEAERASYRKM